MNNGTLDDTANTYLTMNQSDVDSKDTYSDQVARGKELWKSKHSAQFKNIRLKLDSLCVGKRRCNYCEDSVADEIEHIKPKDLYPSLAFVWGNYLFACGNCNGPKSNLFAVFNNNEVVEISRKRNDLVISPLIGEDVFINPRVDSPLEFLILDLKTMNFISKPGLSDLNKKRAQYTIKILKLNTRGFLVEARKEAFNTYRDALQVYVTDKRNGKNKADLLKRQKEMESRQHPTIWAEMRRQRVRYEGINKFLLLAPELLTSAGS